MYPKSEKCPECKKVANYNVEVDEVEQIKAICLDVIDELRWYLHLQKGHRVEVLRLTLDGIKSKFQKILEINSELVFKLKIVKGLTESSRNEDFIYNDPQHFGHYTGFATALSYLEGKELPKHPPYPKKWIEDMTKEEYKKYKQEHSKEPELSAYTTTYRRKRCKKTGKYKNIKVS